MDKQPVPFVLSGSEPEKHPNSPLLITEPPESPLNALTLGQTTITLDHPDFLPGYQEGARQYEQRHNEECTIDADLLLFLVRNGWGDRQHSVFWQTGYIVGWLRSMFAHAYNVGEVL